LKMILSQQQAQQQTQKQLADLIKSLSAGNTSSTASSPSIDVYGLLMNEIEPYNYDAEGTSTFDDWFKRHGVTLNERGKTLTDEAKRNLIVNKLDKKAYDVFCKNILPKDFSTLTLNETIDTLKKLFGPRKSLCKRRFEFYQKTAPPLSSSAFPFRDLSNDVKQHYAEAEMKNIDEDTAQCIAFVSALSDASYTEIRLRLLNKMNDVNAKLKLDDISEECDNWARIRAENRSMDTLDIKAISYKKKTGQQPKYQQQQYQSRNQQQYQKQIPSQQDNSLHSSRNRSRHGSRFRRRSTTPSEQQPRRFARRVAFSDIEDARTYLKVDIDGFCTELQVDTGADITMISRQTWNSIGSPALEPTPLTIKTADGSPMT
ncbi:unnamed protein product, partial [Caenorhabditis auriculariae]